MAGCDVCLTIYRATKEHSWSPNKMFDALAAGKPVLINVPGWLGETIEQNHCGRYVDPHRPESLADALEELSRDPALCRQMGENARALAERQFDRRDRRKTWVRITDSGARKLTDSMPVASRIAEELSTVLTDRELADLQAKIQKLKDAAMDRLNKALARP